MGKVKLEPQPSNNTMNHFSHPEHPLELITHQNFSSSQLCSGCKIQAIGSVYSCKSCNFFLHIECSQMPQQINHPFDKEHTFTLLPKPIYPEGNFRCDACGETGDGFSYHCKSCGTDLHILCAVLPQCVTHWSHHHQLEIQFSSPYTGNSFRCDICKNIGANQWLYRCHSCGFDAHLNCTKLQSPPYQNHFQPIPTSSTNSRSAPQHHSAGVDHMNQGMNNEISSLETLRKQREDEDKLMSEMIMGAVSHENQRLNQLIDVGLGRTNQGINNGTAAAPQFGASQNYEMSLPEILRKQREDEDKMMAEMITGATYRQNQQLSHLIAASSRHNQAINQQFNQTLMNYGSAAAGQGGGIPNLYQNSMGAGGFNSAFGLSALFGNLKF
ncbi:protein VACUOLELESS GAMETOPHYTES [Solanum dulcamara]|uniref:protein VACUOLELESS GAMETOPHYTES n=1 Tax=Solanum dulcamara TaxID=45834 RepID=UPI0024862660|nr:protein VACUOLELESS GAMETOPHYTES [Solanum dulcamara]